MKRPALPPTPRAVTLLMAGSMIVLLFLQLFCFEEMPSILYAAGIDGALTYLLLILFVLSELLSLPYWLGMAVSPVVRRLSIGSAVISLALLVGLELYAYRAGHTIFLGAAFDLPAGEWSLLFVAGIALLGAWGLSYASNKKAKP